MPPRLKKQNRLSLINVLPNSPPIPAHLSMQSWLILLRSLHHSLNGMGRGRPRHKSTFSMRSSAGSAVQKDTAQQMQWWVCKHCLRTRPSCDMTGVNKIASRISLELHDAQHLICTDLIWAQLQKNTLLARPVTPPHIFTPLRQSAMKTCYG